MEKLTRIPLDVVVTATGERTSGKLVAVMADDLDRLEARLEDAIVADIVARNPGINEDDVRHYRATGELPERKA